MAWLPGFNIDWATPANKPQAIGEPVTMQADPAVIVVSQTILTTTTFIIEGGASGTTAYGFTS